MKNIIIIFPIGLLFLSFKLIISPIGKYHDTVKDDNISLNLELKKDHTFIYVASFKLGTCNASGNWKIFKDTIYLTRTSDKNLPDSIEGFFSPHFTGMEKWFHHKDTLFHLDKNKRSGIVLIK